MAAPSRNLEKHTNPNRLHQFLLRRFHRRAAGLVAAASSRLTACGGPLRPLVVDVGCGEGFAGSSLIETLPGLRLVGLDANCSSLSYAREHTEGAGWLAGDAARLPLRAKSIPIIVCFEVLEHLPEPWRALDELLRVCSGYLVLSVPNQPFFALANLLRGKNLRTLGDDPEHLFHWRAATFLRELRRRVRVEQTVYSFPWVLALGKPAAVPGSPSPYPLPSRERERAREMVPGSSGTAVSWTEERQGGVTLQEEQRNA